MTKYQAEWRTHTTANGRWTRCNRVPRIAHTLAEARACLIDEIKNDVGATPPLILAVALVRAERLEPGVILTIPDFPLDPDPWMYRIVEIGGDDD